MAKKFKGGDVVILNSGGPHMTISRYEDDEICSATWWNGSEFTAARFHQESLTKVEKKEAKQ
ncbi:hypothetical protein KASHIRA_02720 [Serratia phage vB_SmaM-Kashira]|nr:hypothetical protein [Acinetobacter phage ABPH49]URC22846.1 hypothetical protein KASHIRA_02720 [Serratia phage vB_SmaM-Kashira]